MRVRIAHLWICAVLVVLCTNLWAFQSSTQFKDMQGNDVQLAAHIGQGKWTLVMLWLSDCGVCAQEAPRYSAFHRDNDVNTQVLGIALDGYQNKSAISDFIDRYGADFPHLVGDFPIAAFNYENRTGESLRGTPTFLLYAPDGELVGNNPGIMRIEALVQFIKDKS